MSILVDSIWCYCSKFTPKYGNLLEDICDDNDHPLFFQLHYAIILIVTKFDGSTKAM